ncbi:efflux RND transporter periplasmic adaptor subunit [Mesorhizobium sp. SP-1A]|uniref:efflux RND transporter periplasmic adaptor subunit n=1 Tax=Mesorhizobium sp. SP-1A TaxID=3077840 RepID=UPI0028F6C2ED|nr:efflux RND transporter periplasmic adaptor subunit [Mesorhizobium sp. SP-1A]
MRAKIVYSLVGAACLAVAAGLYFYPGVLTRTGQTLSHGDDAAPKSPQAGSQQGVSVVAATASTADFPIRRYAIGFIASPAVVNVNARISSQIVSIAVKNGQMVKAGDLLFRLDDRALKAQVARDQAMLDKDQATLVSNTADLARAKDLAAKQAGTRQAYDQALATQKGTAASIEADKAQLDADTIQLGFATITAPITGRLGAVNVTVGDLVGPSNNGNANSSTPLVTITQMDPLEANFTLPESDLDLLHKALAKPQAGAVKLRRDGNPEPVGSGTLDFVDSSVDTASGTIAARASVPNPDLALWPGQYINVVVNAGTMPQMTSIPTIAIQPSQQGPFVYVVKPDSTVEMRPVKVALAEGANSAISNGLKSGEKVVVEGQTRLKNGMAVRAEAAKTADASAAGAAGASLAQASAADGTRP